MPLFGQLDAATVRDRLPRMRDFDTEAWELPNADMLYLALEVEIPDADALLPKAMHPAVPRYVTIVVSRFSQSPVGPFGLAQLRLMGRAGVHPRGYVLQAYTDSEAATEALRQRWGFPAATADRIALQVYYDHIFAAVSVAGETILDVGLSHYEAIAGTDINYIASVHLAEVTEIADPGPRLVQVDPRYTLHRAERGRPVLRAIAPSAWGCPGFKVVNPIVGTFATVDTDFPQIRFVMDPWRPVTEGTTRLR
ncbi:MAG: hypothetical protein KatS3mg131_0482 [Candidatus Tectimicrobiota bacterium]|nr:MAG: hypothetical protein KatS3mg131_0482 [Candidatus Tectomicrobia bacterium]